MRGGGGGLRRGVGGVCKIYMDTYGQIIKEVGSWDNYTEN